MALPVGTSRFEVLPLKFLMHFADGATSYLRPVLMDGFYPHFAGYLGLQMWWLGSHQLSPRKVAASVRDRTADLSHDRPRSYQDATGTSLRNIGFQQVDFLKSSTMSIFRSLLIKHSACKQLNLLFRGCRTFIMN